MLLTINVWGKSEARLIRIYESSKLLSTSFQSLGLSNSRMMKPFENYHSLFRQTQPRKKLRAVLEES